ncbi:WD40-repeat-containing domain protein [Pelagophyceae sp. CCMP2097]|nr:WD40-repeat-containing domain protein [Pelagophyceae sp. CCMP2097]
MTAAFQDRLLDELMPAKLKIKEEPPIVEDVAAVLNTEAEAPGGSVVDDAPDRVLDSRLAWTFAIFLRICAAWAALLWRVFPGKLGPKNEEAIVKDFLLVDGSKAAARLSAIPTEKTAVKTSAQGGDAPNWRGTCAICLDLLPLENDQRMFYDCCCMKICTECSAKCVKYDARCPLCISPPPKSGAEGLRRLQKHAAKGNADAQMMLGDSYSIGRGLKQSFKRALQQYEVGKGAKIDYKTAAHWFRRAAEQGYPEGQCNFGDMFYQGKGVAQSYAEAVRWFRLSAGQGESTAFYNLGVCYGNGHGERLHPRFGLGAERAELLLRSDARICAFSPDGTRIVTASRTTARPHVVSCAVSPDGERLVTAGYDETARLWDAKTGALLAKLEGHVERIRKCAFSPDGKRIKGALQTVLKIRFGHITSCAFSPDGTRIVTTSADEMAYLWDAATGALQTTLEGHTKAVSCCVFSFDGERVVTASVDMTARLWDATTGVLQKTLEGHTHSVTSCAFSPDSKRLVTVGDGMARLWDAETGALQTTLRHSSSILSCAFSPDGKRVVTASFDKRRGRIVTASRDGTARLWDAAL